MLYLSLDSSPNRISVIQSFMSPPLRYFLPCQPTYLQSFPMLCHPSLIAELQEDELEEMLLQEISIKEI
jgi:hypothetical protein